MLQGAFEGLPYILENELDWPAFSTVTGTCVNIAKSSIPILLQFLPSLPLLKQNVDIGDNCIQNFHWGRYIFGYTGGNLVLL